MNHLWNAIRRSYRDSDVVGNTDQMLVIRIDDRNQLDVYPGFCDIHARVSAKDGESFILELRNPPLNSEVREFVAQNGGKIQEAPAVTTVTFNLKVASGGQIIKRLAKAIQRVIRRGQQYPDRNWKWVCPRTAKSLQRFASAFTTCQ